MAKGVTNCTVFLENEVGTVPKKFAAFQTEIRNHSNSPQSAKSRVVECVATVEVAKQCPDNFAPFEFGGYLVWFELFEGGYKGYYNGT